MAQRTCAPLLLLAHWALSLAACGAQDGLGAAPAEGVNDAAVEPGDAASPQADAASDASEDPPADLSSGEDVVGEDTMVEASGADASEQAEVALLSLNLHCLKLDGTPFGSNEARFAAVAQAVAAEGVSAIAIQEACATADANAMEMLQSALVTATATVWQKAWLSTHTAWQGTPDEASEGVGLLVRGAMSDVRPIVYRVPGALARGAISAVLPPELGGFRLVSTHLDYSDASARAAQARETAAVSIALNDPSLNVVVAGDFNASEGSPAYEAMVGFGYKDWAASLDPARIDHVFAHRGAALEVQEARFVFDGAAYPVVSDHPGVLVRARRATPASVTRTRLRLAHSGGEWLAVRGNVGPLTWQEGYAAYEVPAGWLVVLTEVGQGVPFEFKCLRQDATWETGDNHAGQGGDTIDVTPVF